MQSWLAPMQRKSMTLALRQRYEIAAGEVGLSQLVLEPDSSIYAAVISKVQENECLSPLARAGVAWLICTGRYPEEEHLEFLAMALDAKDVNLAVKILTKGVAKTPRRARSRRLVTVDTPLVDVTRTALETGLSGIPRIVRLVAQHSARLEKGTLVVWVAGAPARVELDPDGNFYYPPEVWGGSRRWFSFSRVLRVTYWRLMSGLSSLPGGFAARGILRTILAPLKLLDIGVSMPQEIVWIPEAGILESEVSVSRAARHLVVWLEAFPQIPLTVLVHDALPLTSPQFFPRDQRLEYLEYARLLERASCLIVANFHLREVMVGLSAVQGRVKPPKIEVVPFPTYSHEWDDSASVVVKQSAFYMVGSPDGRKNYQVAVAAAQLVAEWGHQVELHIIGSAKGVAPGLRDAIARARRAGVSIQTHGPVPDEVVLSIARQSLALVYVSKAEGYGLPVREAQALGCPVIASNIPSNVELARSGGVSIVDHLSPTAVARAMKDLIDGKSDITEYLADNGRVVNVHAYGKRVFELVGSENSEREQMNISSQPVSRVVS